MSQRGHAPPEQQVAISTPAPRPPAGYYPGRSTSAQLKSMLRGCTLGCLLPTLVVGVISAGSIFAYRSYSESQREAQVEARQEAVASEVAPTLEKLRAPASVAAADAPFDLDKTVRVIHEIDEAIKRSADLPAYLSTLGAQDYRGVAPDLLAARADLMEQLTRLYGAQLELEDQQAAWRFGGELTLTVLSAIKVDTGIGGLPGAIVTGQFGLDQDKLDQALEQTRAHHQEQRALTRALRESEQALLSAVLQYGTLYAKYISAWDNLCVLRDRAYLASHEHDWARAEEAAAQAMTLAPQETEAHLLRAMALIEQARSNPETADKIAPARAILADYLKAHPERSAPALLLEGVALGYAGDQAGAKLALQQAAAYYPRQSEHLQDMLNPYRMREFLRKSREGNFIIEQYKATMLGAGYFSPDLQLARLHFEAGDHEAGHAKLLDHFSRRRAQGQWDFILSDLAFCERTMGPHWRRVFPQEPYLDLKVTPSLIGSELSVEVNNRSERTLRNATLVLALRFTDMHRDDYQTFTPTRTLPALLARDVTSFGDVPISATLLGQEKTTADVVQHRAILVSDEAVSWVDTDEYKLAEHKELRQQRWYQQVAARNAAGDDAAFKALGYSRDSFEQMLVHKSTLSISDELGKDNVQVAIPAPLAMLRPLFKLRRGQASFEPQLNMLDTDQIQLTFKSVANFNDSDQQATPLDLTIDGLFGDSYTLRWAWGQTQPELIRQPR